MTRVLPGPLAGTSLKKLVGSGDRIGLFTTPFLLVGLVLNIAYPWLFGIGGPSGALRVVAVVALAAGVTIWALSVVLIVTHVPRGDLITTGPYAVVKHPLYTAVALLVLPGLGVLLDSWLGAVLGAVMYVGSRIFARAEEAGLSRSFGAEWTRYAGSVKIPWL
jgi:protein-S-isoprenylcysteine O-methyltransferase Ste14